MSIYKFIFFLFLRTFTYGIGFFITVIIFFLSGSDNSLIKASPWWPVYGLLANFLCFIILTKQFKSEKLTLWSLINYRPEKIKKDLITGLFFIFLSIIIATSSSIGFGYLLYDRFPNELMLSFKEIPTLVIILIVLIFPLINSVLEEVTYNGYIYPRLELRLKNIALTVIIVLLFFTIQHIFITFKPDLKYMIWRLLSFVPLLFFWIMIFVKMRRLTTLILVHWFMDTFAIFSILLGTE
ncbi:MAG TPA: hypothetical protein DEO54_05490 [Rikenellaceae bacterium]|nr:MAG: hypothetical protein A2X20_01325 [Bacteroidetes bacterium GWE2_40_15]HBZ25680.1 hypothetical protein [Rikenellaceae bacterium]